MLQSLSCEVIGFQQNSLSDWQLQEVVQ